MADIGWTFPAMNGHFQVSASICKTVYGSPKLNLKSSVESSILRCRCQRGKSPIGCPFNQTCFLGDWPFDPDSSTGRGGESMLDWWAVNTPHGWWFQWMKRPRIGGKPVWQRDWLLGSTSTGCVRWNPSATTVDGDTSPLSGHHPMPDGRILYGIDHRRRFPNCSFLSCTYSMRV